MRKITIKRQLTPEEMEIDAWNRRAEKRRNQEPVRTSNGRGVYQYAFVSSFSKVMAVGPDRRSTSSFNANS
jgi:hypothetical protein